MIMKSYCFIYEFGNNNCVEFCSIPSVRFDFLKSISGEMNNLVENAEAMTIQISKQYLLHQIDKLLLERLALNEDIQFDNRFSQEFLFQELEFNDKKLKLRTSGMDNLIIFAVNIYNTNGDKLKLLFSDRKNFPV